MKNQKAKEAPIKTVAGIGAAAYIFGKMLDGI